MKIQLSLDKSNLKLVILSLVCINHLVSLKEQIFFRNVKTKECFVETSAFLWDPQPQAQKEQIL